MPRLSPRRLRRAVFAAGCTAALVGTVLASTVTGASAAPARAVTKAPAAVVPGSDYLALGDSVSFGYRESTVVPAPDYKDAASFLGYPEMLASELGLHVANAACPGETSSSLLNAKAQSNGCENTPGDGNIGYRTLYPLHVKYTGSQIAYAESYLKTHKDTRLVTLMIGANDAFVCQETTTDKCSSDSELEAVLTTLGSNVARILRDIRTTAHYTGQIVIVNYYSLDYAVPLDNDQSLLLNNTVDKAAKPFDVKVAASYADFAAASKDSGNDTCTAGLLTQLVGASTPCGIHPSYAGQALLAQSVEEALTL